MMSNGECISGESDSTLEVWLKEETRKEMEENNIMEKYAVYTKYTYSSPQSATHLPTLVILV